MALITLLALLLLAAPVLAANPILPGWEYIPDGEPRVFGDRVYLYGSHDTAGSKRFCDYILRVWSAPLSDLNTWTDHGVSFATRDQEGHKDDVPWSDNELYAPDVVEKDGRYYLYAYIVGAPAAVAVSDTPSGPFKLVSRILAPAGSAPEFGGWGQYADPAVLVDDDGKVYLYWGYKQSHLAQLDPDNMFQVLPGTYRADPIPNTAPYDFFEAASMRKIGDTYYFVYADGGILTYATSKSPEGPFAYGGHIIRNGHDYPGGNNHGSLANLNGQWFIFYHRMTNNTIFSRKACVERVTIEPDGSIKEVEQTSLGFQEHLDPLATTPAEIACVLKGGNYITEFDRETRAVIRNRNGSIIGYKYFEFGDAGDRPLTFSAEFRRGPATGRMEIRLDDWDTGPVLGVLPLTGPQGERWETLSTRIPAVDGRHALYFKFVADDPDGDLGDLRSFTFAPL